VLERIICEILRRLKILFIKNKHASNLTNYIINTNNVTSSEGLLNIGSISYLQHTP
jgi:hypothetical protein